MSTNNVALPPGVYTISSSESTPRNIVNPKSNGAQLYVTKAAATAVNQQVRAILSSLIYDTRWNSAAV
jgi:hypothetical protein